MSREVSGAPHSHSQISPAAREISSATGERQYACTQSAAACHRTVVVFCSYWCEVDTMYQNMFHCQETLARDAFTGVFHLGVGKSGSGVGGPLGPVKNHLLSPATDVSKGSSKPTSGFYWLQFVEGHIELSSLSSKKLTYIEFRKMYDI